MIEVEMDGEKVLRGDGDIELTDVVHGLLDLMAEMGWGELKLKDSPGFTVGSRHRQIIVDGVRYQTGRLAAVQKLPIEEAQVMMWDRKMKVLVVRDVIDE